MLTPVQSAVRSIPAARVALLLAAVGSLAACSFAQPAPAPATAPPIDTPPADTPSADTPDGPMLEVRGTWLTTTANDAIANPSNTRETMRQLADIGLNTVYVEVWKNGYTQFPSQVLERTIGVDRRPALTKSDPSDTPDRVQAPGRDLLQETLVEAHRQGLNYIAWFEYGFMAAHKDTDNHLRRMKPQWLSRDINGQEVAPNGFVWMNPLHPEARRFLLDIVLEAVDRYDLDGVQLDDRIVWPYYTMGYDDFTKAAYAAEHNGQEPPKDPKDPAWVRWRADKVNEYSKMFVQEIRARRPGVVISLSPAVYPWSYEHYCLEWPTWGAWKPGDALTLAPGAMANTDPATWPGTGVAPRWDEFIPQVYRFNFPAFRDTWNQQVEHMNTLGGRRVRDLIAGIRVVGDGPNSTWEDLRASIDLVRQTRGGGHVHWFSRGVLEVYPRELKAMYDGDGPARNPRFPRGWRSRPIVLSDKAPEGNAARWSLEGVPAGVYHELWVHADGSWHLGDGVRIDPADPKADTSLVTGGTIERIELLPDRRPQTTTRRPWVGQNP